MAVTGTGLSRLFNLEHNKFKIISCKNCGYSEFYRAKSTGAMNIIDFFFADKRIPTKRGA
ncbi:zinc ribbon domain-containing protein [Laceyella putida]|uniref:Zinc ribbon domain-containing protein n=1 Tax=Laceyella putida TaxID=110101 RepID=A0ABW2RQ51_9BACL